MKKITCLLLALLIISPSLFSEDILTLNDQNKFKGKVTKIKKSKIIFIAEGNRYVIPMEQIFSVEFEDTNDEALLDIIAFDSVPINVNKCEVGRIDATEYHGKVGGHVVLGFFFGPFAMLGTALANPTPYKSNKTPVFSKNKELFSDIEYLHCYKKRAKGKLIGAEAIGWGAWLLLLVLIY